MQVYHRGMRTSLVGQRWTGMKTDDVSRRDKEYGMQVVFTELWIKDIVECITVVTLTQNDEQVLMSR